MSWIYGYNFSLSAWFASSFTGSSRSADGNGWRTAVLGLGLADKANKRTLGRNHLQKADAKVSTQLEAVSTTTVTHLQPYMRNPQTMCRLKSCWTRSWWKARYCIGKSFCYIIRFSGGICVARSKFERCSG